MRKFLLTLVFSAVFIGTARAATITKTICSSGCDYTSLSACMSGNAQNLTDAGGDIFHAEISGNFQDTSTVTVSSSWTTSATCYVNIYTTAAARHAGVWDTGKYRLDVSTGAAITINTNYVRVEGLQIQVTTSGGNDGILILAVWLAGEQRLSKNIIKLVSQSGAGGCYAVYWGDSDQDAKVWNNIIYDWDISGGYDFNGILLQSCANAYIYNNTIHNCREGIERVAGTAIAKNNITNDCRIDGWVGTFDAASDYNASDRDSDAPGANSRNGTNGVVTFKNEGGDDFRLAASDNNARKRGTTNPGSGLYSDDIEGQARVAPWDIGADEVPSGNAIFFGTNF